LVTPTSPRRYNESEFQPQEGDNLETEGASVLLSLSKGRKELSEDEKSKKKRETQQKKVFNPKREKFKKRRKF